VKAVPRLAIAGRAIPAGSAVQIFLKVSEFYTAAPVNVPLTVVRGARRGPIVFLTAAVHGDELNGVEVVRRIMTGTPPETLRGTLICAPVVNRPGFLGHSRYLPGHQDLNRCFPGDPDGNAAQRLAHILFREIVARADRGIDLHTASHGRTNLPHVRADMTDEKARRMARNFGSEIIVDHAGTTHTLRAAATRAGVPTILFEAGETFRFQRSMVARGVRGVRNVLAALKMIPSPRRAARFQVVIKASEWVRAPRGGIADVQVRPGEIVYPGQVIASITNPFGREVSSVRATATGLVLGINTVPLAHPGDAICHVARLRRTLATLESFAVTDSHGRRMLLVEGA
jgi:predicted deacylase